MAWRCHCPPGRRWSTPEAPIAWRSRPGQLGSLFKRRLFRSPRCEAAKPTGFMAGICQINHTPSQRRTTPPPIRALGARSEFRLAVQPPLSASSVLDLSRSTSLFISKAKDISLAQFLVGAWTPIVLSPAPSTNIQTCRLLFSPDTCHLLVIRSPQRQR